MTDLKLLEDALKDDSEMLYCQIRGLVYLTLKNGRLDQYIPLVNLEEALDTEDVLTFLFLNYSLRECNCSTKEKCYIK